MEINELQEKVLRLEQQLTTNTEASPEQCTEHELHDLKSKLQLKVPFLILISAQFVEIFNAFRAIF